MAASLLLLLQLVSLASASHHYGGTVSYSYKGRNPDGSFRVDFRNKATYDGCQYSHSWSCYNNNCGYVTNQQRGITDRSTNAPQRWRFQTQVDLGSRSDTGKPNRSPDIAILPFLRVPQNCPRTYKLMSFDPDGDTVRCRYGNIRNIESSGCNQPSGFVLDQGSCSLHYRHAIANPSVFGFELVVEDFPERPISLTDHDSSRKHYDTNNTPMGVVVSSYTSSTDHNCSTNHNPMAVVVSSYTSSTDHDLSTNHNPMVVVVSSYTSSTDHDLSTNHNPMAAVVVSSYNSSNNYTSDTSPTSTHILAVAAYNSNHHRQPIPAWHHASSQ
ncbi:hypothetical protein NQZ68_023726 [Dissostichus eleginoides]|nr:hypothetical protein NQZ68_023726 [Dissostichus eleginoides]